MAQVKVMENNPSGMGILTHPQGNLSFEYFKNYVDKLKDRLIYKVLYFQGKPFLNPDLLNMVKYTGENRVYTMVSTNGHFFTDEAKVTEVVKSGLGSLAVALDGINRKSYEKYRKNAQLEKVIEGVQRLVRIKKNMKSKYRRYKKQNGKYELKGKIRNRCFKLWSDVLITWEGAVIPCCFDKDAEFVFGNLQNGGENFREIWRGEKYQQFGRKILTNRSQIPMCNNCTEGVKIFAGKADVP